MKTLTILQLPGGDSYGTTLEQPQDMAYRLTQLGCVVQRLDNLVRIARYPSEWTVHNG